MRWIILILIMTHFYAENIGQCDSILNKSEPDRIDNIKEIEKKSKALLNYVEDLIDRGCYDIAFDQQVKKVQHSTNNFPFHEEYKDLQFFDSLVAWYIPMLTEKKRDSVLTDNIIAWADFNERTGYHSKTFEKFEFYNSKYSRNSEALPDELLIRLERSLRYTGSSYLRNKEYGIALEYYNDAKDISSLLSNRESRLTRGSINRGYISYVYLLTRNIPKSKSLLYEHLRMSREAYELDEAFLPHYLTAYRNLSELYILENKLDTARYYIDQSITLEERHNRSRTNSLKIKARILLKQKEDLLEKEAAIKIETEVRKILSSLFEKRNLNNDPSRYIHFTDNLEIANLLVDGQMYAEADTLLEFIESINDMRMKNEDVQHPNFYSNKNIYLDILLCRLRIKENFDEVTISKKIRNAYKIIDESIEKAISKETKLNFASQSAKLTEYSLLNLSDLESFGFEDIFHAIESSKAATSFKSWLQNQLMSFDNNENLILAEQKLEVRLKRISEELTKPISSVRMLQLNNTLSQYTLKLDSVKDQLKEDHPEYYKMKYNWSIPSLAEVQNSLDDEEVLINYYEGEEILYAMIIANDYKHFKEIGSVSILKDSISYFSKEIKGKKYWNTSNSTVSNYIYQQIMAPLEDSLKGRVIISPSGSLFQVPFAALNTSSEGEVADYLIKDHTISYVPSCSFFHQLREIDEDNTIAKAVFVAPRFSIAQPSGMQFAMRSELFPLKFNLEEVQAISKMLDSELLVNENATKKSAFDLFLDADIIHLSTHAKSNMDSPEKSYVAFYKSDENNDEGEYKWYLNDISKSSLSAKMIVLSACETGLGQVYKGEGAMSLANSCFYAGAQSVVASLWSADDSSSYKLMKDFYANLSDGIPKDSAMQKAQIDYLDGTSGINRNLYYWSGFSVIGNTDTLHFKKTPNYRNWLFITFGMFALLLFLLQIRLLVKKK